MLVYVDRKLMLWAGVAWHDMQRIGDIEAQQIVPRWQLD